MRNVRTWTRHGHRQWPVPLLWTLLEIHLQVALRMIELGQWIATLPSYCDLARLYLTFWFQFAILFTRLDWRLSLEISILNIHHFQSVALWTASILRIHVFPSLQRCFARGIDHENSRFSIFGVIQWDKNPRWSVARVKLNSSQSSFKTCSPLFNLSR